MNVTAMIHPPDVNGASRTDRTMLVCTYILAADALVLAICAMILLAKFIR